MGTNRKERAKIKACWKRSKFNLHQCGPRCEPINFHDSFLGGTVWGLASGRSLQNAFRYGNAAGSAAVLTPGNELCRPADVERLYDQVIVQTIWERRPAAE